MSIGEAIMATDPKVREHEVNRVSLDMAVRQQIFCASCKVVLDTQKTAVYFEQDTEDKIGHPLALVCRSCAEKIIVAIKQKTTPGADFSGSIITWKKTYRSIWPFLSDIATSSAKTMGPKRRPASGDNAPRGKLCKCRWCIAGRAEHGANYVGCAYAP